MFDYISNAAAAPGGRELGIASPPEREGCGEAPACASPKSSREAPRGLRCLQEHSSGQTPPMVLGSSCPVVLDAAAPCSPPQDPCLALVKLPS